MQSNSFPMELSAAEVGRSSVVFVAIILCMMTGLASANVVLIGKNVSLSVDDAEANFAPPLKGSGECGVLFVAEPLDACSPLKNKIPDDPKSQFVLIIRGGCTFDEKVRTAQDAGFKAAIVYDNEDSGVLVSRASTGIHIYAVFVTKASGENLIRYAGRSDVETWIIPTFENSVWSIMAISFISLLSMAAVLATCFFVRRHRIRREQPRASNIREFHGMSKELVKAMPSLVFTSVMDDSCTSMTCAICLEDYSVGEMLRILPCHHKFHSSCVDAWLTNWRSFCPVCKQDTRAGFANCPANERTPLLSSGSGAASPALSSALSSFHSSVASSPAIQIAPRPPRLQSSSRPGSLSSTPHIPRSNRSYSHSPAIHISRSSVDLRNSASLLQRSASQISSPHSFGFHTSSPRYGSPYIHSSSIGSHSYLAASSSRQSHLRRCNDSRDSLSGLASARSLPGC